MRVIENGDDRFVLGHVPVGLGLALLALSLVPFAWGVLLANAGEYRGALVLIAISLLMFFGCFGVFARSLRLTLDRGRNLVEIEETSLLGRKRREHPLEGLHGATLEAARMDKAGARMAHSFRTGGNRRHRRMQRPRAWRAVLVHRKGFRFPVTEGYGSERTAQAIAGAINAWFGSEAPG